MFIRLCTYICKCVIFLPAQGRVRVVIGVLVAGTGLLEIALVRALRSRALRRSISNSANLFHNSSLSFSLFFSLQFRYVRAHNNAKKIFIYLFQLDYN